MNPSTLLALGLDGMAAVLAFGWMGLALADERTRMRALGYLSGLGMGGVASVYGPIAIAAVQDALR